MNIFKKLLAEDLYTVHLKTVEGIKFTRREIDIISCMVNSRIPSKEIAAILLISTKTIDNYIRDILGKLGSPYKYRYQIVDFIKKTDKYNILKNEYYRAVQYDICFKQCLESISWYSKNHEQCCFLLPQDKQKFVMELYTKIVADLNRIKIKIITHSVDEGSPITFRFFFIEETIPSEQDKTVQKQVLYLKFDREDNSTNEIHELINLEVFESYYDAFFSLLKFFLREEDISSSIEKFNEKLKNIDGEKQPDMAIENSKSIYLSLKDLSKKSVIWFCCIFSVFVVSAFTFSIYVYVPSQPVRSELILPHESYFLNRRNTIEQIRDIFKKQRGIQTVALIGIGGSGKTTLATQYASLQNFDVIWKVSSKDKASIFDSYEHLLYNLAKDDQERNEINHLETIKDRNIRNETILSFLKKKMKATTRWLLIFDNVEQLEDIQELLPRDPIAWGNGQVLITTRNQNIKFNLYIGGIIYVNELNDEQKYDLFSRIYGKEKSIIDEQIPQIKEFLRIIPSFPLDILTSASYLRSTKISFNEYKELISKQQPEFADFEKIILKSVGEYSQTRSNIIKLSLEKIVNKTEEFKKLLYFISLINNYGIPIVFLELIASKRVVDQFLFNLNEYSLIMGADSFDSSSSFSIHDATHEIIKKFIENDCNLKNKASSLEVFSTIIRDKLYSTVFDETNLPQTKLLLNHCVKFLKNSELFLQEELKQDISAEIGRAYFYLGDYRTAKIFLDDSLVVFKARKKESEKRRISDLRLLCFIGDLYGSAMLIGAFERDTQEFQNLTKLLEEEVNSVALKSKKEFFSEGLIYLGLMYQFLAYLKDEDKVEEIILKVCEQQNVEEKLLSFSPKIGAFSFYIQDSELKKIYEKAHSLTQQGFDIVLDTFGPEHKNAGFAYHYMGISNNLVGKHEDARKMLEKANDMYKKTYPSENIRIGWSAFILATIYVDLGLFERAQPLFENALMIYKKYYDSSNNMILKFENQMSENLMQLGRLDEAEKNLKENLGKTILSPNTNTIKTIQLLIKLYQKKIDQKQRIEKNKTLQSGCITLLCKKIKEKVDQKSFLVKGS